MMKMLIRAKEAETKAYFDGLAGLAIKKELSQNENKDDKQKETNPLETIFTLNLRESLLSFADYHSKIMDEKETKLAEIKKKFAVGN